MSHPTTPTSDAPRSHCDTAENPTHLRSGKPFLKVVPSLLKETALCWYADQCYRLGAALSFYALFSLFPLLLLLVSACGFLLGNEATTRASILAYFDSVESVDVRHLLDETLTSMQHNRTAGSVGAIVGLLTLMLGGSGVFAELDSGLNRIWRVPEAPSAGALQSILVVVKERALAVVAVLAAGLLLLASLALSTILLALGSSSHGHLVEAWSFQVVELATITFGLATVFRILPKTAVAWRDVLGGAILTALLLAALKRLLSLYLIELLNYAAYGAVGAILVLLTWIYLASQVVFFGAEFTHVFAKRYGSLASAAVAA
jgi:membrane protein